MTVALVVVDMQHDFCVGPAAKGDPGTLRAVVTNTARAVRKARQHGVEVVFVRFVGDPEHQGPSWRRRDALLGKQPKCLSGSKGADFYEVHPDGDERVFTKPARFDAFLAGGFEQHLHRQGFRHLVFAGLYTDVCVDSTARTAFQKGFHVTLLTDCTLSMHLSDIDILRFMRVVYGARTLTHTEDEWLTDTTGTA